MKYRRGYRHKITIDDQIIVLDSATEEQALRRFIDKYGFRGQWVRPLYGIKHNGKFYSPDFELCVDDSGRSSRALVEVKPCRVDFTNDIASRMLAVSHHYNTRHLYLYTVIKDEWYRLNDGTMQMERCIPPVPGAISIGKLYRPNRYLVRNYYGRKYYQSFTDGSFSLLRKMLRGASRTRRGE